MYLHTILQDTELEEKERNHEKAMGREGCGSMDDNGERLLEFYTKSELVIGGTLMKHL